MASTDETSATAQAHAQSSENGAAPTSTALTSDSTSQSSKLEGKKAQKEGTNPANGAGAIKSDGKKAQKDGPKAADGASKLSNKDLKAQKQAEKQAKRAAAKAQTENAGPSGSGAPTTSGQPVASNSDGRKAQGEVAAKGKQGQQNQEQQRGGLSGTAQRARTLSQSQGQRPTSLRNKAQVKEPRKVNKEVGLFGHLYNQPRRYTMEGVSKEVHPAVLALGFQMSNYVICGSNARCVAMLLAFKKVCLVDLRSIHLLAED